MLSPEEEYAISGGKHGDPQKEGYDAMEAEVFGKDGRRAQEEVAAQFAVKGAPVRLVPGGGSRHTEAVPSDAEEIAQLKLEVARLGRLVDGLYVRLDGVAPDAHRRIIGATRPPTSSTPCAPATSSRRSSCGAATRASASPRRRTRSSSCRRASGSDLSRAYGTTLWLRLSRFCGS